MANNYSYMRISTKEDRSLQKFTRQSSALSKYAKQNNIEYILTFKEDVSGKNFKDRKEWQKLEQIAKSGDTIYFKDISRFTRNTDEGFNKYMELMEKGIDLIFLDNPTVSTSYIKQLLDIAKAQNIVAKTSLESTVKLLLIVELDRVEQERLTTIKRIKDGIAASDKTSGRAKGSLDKLTPELKADIKLYLKDRNITQAELVKKHHISVNTFKKYKDIIAAE